MVIKTRMIPFSQEHKGKTREAVPLSAATKPNANYSKGGGIANTDLKKVGRNLAKIKAQERG